MASGLFWKNGIGVWVYPQGAKAILPGAKHKQDGWKMKGSKSGNEKNGFRIGELSGLTGVKAGTIRFYEKCGFLSPVKRLPNGYRVFEEKHVYQIRICRLVFGGFVNKRLRRISMGLIAAAREWDLKAYRSASADYLRAVEADIERTKKAVDAVTRQMEAAGSGRSNGRQEGGICGAYPGGGQAKNGFPCAVLCSKKQAASIVGVTPEAIRNWERNGLLGQAKAYQKRYYPREAVERMYVIRLLLDNGYSMMAVRKFFAAFDAEGAAAAVCSLTEPGEDGALIYRADRYLETLRNTKEKAEELFALSDEML